MTRFSISLAGFVVDVEAMYASTQEFCGDFLTDSPADFSIVLSQEDIDREQSLTDETVSPQYLETLALLRKVSEELIRRDTILFQGSALAFDGKAYIFTAPAGTGKTTHARLWTKTIPGSYVLNGDKPFLRVMDGQVWVCGSPWRGKENYGVNEMLPLAGICLLDRDSFNHIEAIQCAPALGMLIPQTYRPEDPYLLMKSLQLIGDIAQSVHLYHLGCTITPEAARISRAAMAR